MNIAIFCSQTNFNRLVNTVLTRLNQLSLAVNIVETSHAAVEIGIVDATNENDAEMARMAVKQQPGLQLIHIISDVGRPLAAREVLRNNIVVGLMPEIKKIADLKAQRIAAEMPAAPVSTKRILSALAVDDSPTVRAQLVSIITRLGMQCDTAESAAVALQKMQSNSYDILYVDVVMPDMNGYELTKTVKRDRTKKNLPVIILTSQSSPFDRARGALAGCDTYLVKPVDIKRFFEATSKVLSKAADFNPADVVLIDPARTSATMASAALSSNPGFSAALSR
jgi:CheY-like chemotaxis protein